MKDGSVNKKNRINNNELKVVNKQFLPVMKY
jgi:hypothetical protein